MYLTTTTTTSRRIHELRGGVGRPGGEGGGWREEAAAEGDVEARGGVGGVRHGAVARAPPQLRQHHAPKVPETDDDERRQQRWWLAVLVLVLVLWLRR